MSGVPFSSVRLDTPRLELRPFTEGDTQALFDVYRDPQVCRYLSRGAWTDIAQARERIGKDLRDMAANEHLRLALVRREDGRLLGDCCLFNFNAQCRRAELGYAMARDAWGAGYMNEALRRFVRFAFEDLDLMRLEADIDPRNLGSARSLERLGFAKEGHLRDRWIVEGEVSDTALYGLLRREWRGERV